ATARNRRTESVTAPDLVDDLPYEQRRHSPDLPLKVSGTSHPLHCDVTTTEEPVPHLRPPVTTTPLVAETLCPDGTADLHTPINAHPIRLESPPLPPAPHALLSLLQSLAEEYHQHRSSAMYAATHAELQHRPTPPTAPHYPTGHQGATLVESHNGTSLRQSVLLTRVWLEQTTPAADPVSFPLSIEAYRCTTHSAMSPPKHLVSVARTHLESKALDPAPAVALQ